MKKLASLFLAALLAVSVTACGNNDNNNSDNGSNNSVNSTQNNAEVALDNVITEIKNQVTLPEMTVYSDIEDLLDLYGIKSNDVKQFTAQINSDGLAQDEIVIVEAVNAESAEKIRERLQKRYDSKLAQNESYNPEQAKIIKACKVEVNGNFVSLIVSPDAEKITEIYKSYL